MTNASCGHGFDPLEDDGVISLSLQEDSKNGTSNPCTDDTDSGRGHGVAVTVDVEEKGVFSWIVGLAASSDVQVLIHLRVRYRGALESVVEPRRCVDHGGYCRRAA